MTPLFIWAIMGTIMGLKRVCPRCKRSQVVPSDKKQRPVHCKYCGADIPSKMMK
jgi:DNA-directed RNA polymerase subunit RPC12/RpoP